MNSTRVSLDTDTLPSVNGYVIPITSVEPGSDADELFVLTAVGTATGAESGTAPDELFALRVLGTAFCFRVADFKTFAVLVGVVGLSTALGLAGMSLEAADVTFAAGDDPACARVGS